MTHSSKKNKKNQTFRYSISFIYSLILPLITRILFDFLRNKNTIQSYKKIKKNIHIKMEAFYGLRSKNYFKILQCLSWQ